MITFESAEWMNAANCVGELQTIFAHNHNAARKLCNSCPVKLECAKYAFTLLDDVPPISSGIWAGFTVSELRELRTKLINSNVISKR